MIDRRSFLRRTAGGTAAIAFASLLPAGCSSDYPQAQTDKASLRVLTAKQYAVARAAAEAILIGVPVSAALVARRIDEELYVVGEPVRSDMQTVLGLFEHLTLLGGRTRRFTELTPEERLSYLQGWSRSRLKLRRGAYFALKGFVQYFAYIDDATRSLTRFQGPWPERLTMPVKPVDFGVIA